MSKGKQMFAVKMSPQKELRRPDDVFSAQKQISFIRSEILGFSGI